MGTLKKIKKLKKIRLHHEGTSTLTVSGISLLAFSPVVSVPFFAAVFFLLSVPFAWLLYLIPGAGNYLV